jgi:hypothetical protein
MFVSLGTISLIVWLFFSPPKGTREAIARLNPERNPNPSDRIEAIHLIINLALAGSRLSGWQQLQTQACQDPDAKVRVAALQALGEFTETKADQVVVKNAIGEFYYINTDSIDSMGRSDPTPEVRAAVAEFWGRADVLWKPGIKSMEEMLTNERQPDVASSIREALARRVSRSLARGDLDETSAEKIQKRHHLPDVISSQKK